MTVLIIIMCYLSLLLLLGFFSSRSAQKTSSDFFLAGRSIGPFLLFMSLFGTTMTAFALVGSSGEAYERGIGVYGLMASASGIVHSAVFFLIGMKLWVFGKKYGYVTQIQYFRDRFESDGIGLLLFPVLVLLVLPYLLIGLLASGINISVLTKGALPSIFAGGSVPPWLGTLIICVVVLTYIFFGGIRGAAWANAFQTCVFIILGMVAFYMISDALGGMKNATQMVLDKRPDLLTRHHISKFEFATYMLIPLSVGMFPHLFQHWLTAKSAKSFRLSIIAHPIFIMLVWIPCVLIGIWASSAVVNGVLVVPEGTRGNQALVRLIHNLLADPVLTGLLGAGILAAIMSSLDSQFLCLGTMFTNDIVLHYVGEDKVSQQNKVWLARGFIIAIVAVTYILSLQNNPRQIFSLAIWCFTGFSSLFPLVFASIYWKRTTKAGAFASILTAVGMWILFFAMSGWGKQKSFMLHEISPIMQASLEPLNITIMPVLPIILCSATVLIIVSLLTSPPSQETLSKFFKGCAQKQSA